MKTKTLFYCTDCGNELLKWQGRCPACGAWNTIVEQPAGGSPRFRFVRPWRSPKTVANGCGKSKIQRNFDFKRECVNWIGCWAAALFRVLWCSSAARPESENLL